MVTKHFHCVSASCIGQIIIYVSWRALNTILMKHGYLRQKKYKQTVYKNRSFSGMVEREGWDLRTVIQPISLLLRSEITPEPPLRNQFTLSDSNQTLTNG